jgi:hypothetical protein
MRLIDVRGANDPPKSAKVLAGQDHGCKNGLRGTTALINAVRRNGSRKSPEHRRMFIEGQIQR